MNCKHKSLENIHCFKCDKTHHEIVKELKAKVELYEEIIYTYVDPFACSNRVEKIVTEIAKKYY